MTNSTPPPHRSSKTGFYVLEGLNAFATTYYFYYLFFFMERQFGFGNLQNLLLSATNGLIYTFAAWQGGRWAQRWGYGPALRVGFGGMALALLVGLGVSTAPGQVAVMSLWTVGMCFTWPTLEAAVSEGEPRRRLPRRIGIYNLVWAGSSAVAFFAGGALLDWIGPRSLFVLPAGIHLVQLGVLERMRRRPADPAPPPAAAEVADRWQPPTGRPAMAPTRARMFLHLAWLANPLAYVAINTVVALIPDVSRRLGLTATAAGVFCSIWFFARFGAFVGLWLWPGWHYRLRWFLGGYGLLVVCLASILLVARLPVLLVAQVGFGVAVGLLYYSSLFYSMDVGETKGEHGGLHEAAIGSGIFLGPAVGAGALYCFPRFAQSGAWAVSGLLLAGLGGLVYVWRRGAGPGGEAEDPPSGTAAARPAGHGASET